jgi:hypothetical protein
MVIYKIQANHDGMGSFPITSTIPVPGFTQTPAEAPLISGANISSLC